MKNNIATGNVQMPKTSLLGTHSICTHVKDGKGIIYCHTSGDYSGQVFYVPMGIGWFYKNVLKGSQSEIGLPISNEIYEEPNTKKMMFEAGSIEFSSSTSICKAFDVETGLVIKEMKL